MSNVVIPSSPNDREAIKGAISEISDSLTRIEGEREHINEVLGNIEERYEIPKKYARQIAKMYHKDNVSDVKAEFSDIETLYEQIVGSSVI
jgi:polyhydroxyalkanoate synthesis regulator phasin